LTQDTSPLPASVYLLAKAEQGFPLSLPGPGRIGTPWEREARRRWLLVLLLTSSPAWAEWVSVFETDGAVLYIDPATIETDTYLRQVWELQDLKSGMEGDRSAKVFVEYDCKAQRYRWLRADWFSG
jgi:hypothetical protein